MLDGGRGKDCVSSKEEGGRGWGAFPGLPCDFHFLQGSHNGTQCVHHVPVWIAQMGRKPGPPCVSHLGNATDKRNHSFKTKECSRCLRPRPLMDCDGPVPGGPGLFSPRSLVSVHGPPPPACSSMDLDKLPTARCGSRRSIRTSAL